MVRYTAWFGVLGTMAASSLQPYYSAVNKFFRDHKRPPIAVGELLADARRGLEMLQRPLVPADTRVPLPVPVALDILLAANTLRDNLAWSPAALSLLQRFRACLVVCDNYTFFCRAETCARCLTGDLIVDRPTQQVVRPQVPRNKLFCLSASPKGTSAATPATNSSSPSRYPQTPSKPTS
jgi:hypothetical protein